MVFRNTETGQEGNLKQLLPKLSSPQNLSTAELANLNIVKVEVQPKPYDIERHRTQVINLINSTYGDIRNEGFMTTQNIKMDFDDDSINNYTQAFILMKETGLQEINIIDFNNVTKTVNMSDFTSILTQMGQEKIKLIHTARTLKDMALNATTEEQLNNVWWRKALYDNETLKIISYEYNPILGGN